MSEQERESFKPDADEDVEGHGFTPEPAEEKYESDEGDDVEGHGWAPPGKFKP